jgi:hypothetical protein
MPLLTLKRQDFVKTVVLLLENCATYCLDPEPEQEQEPEPKTFPKSEPEPQQIIAVPQHCSLAPFATTGL